MEDHSNNFVESYSYNFSSVTGFQNLKVANQLKIALMFFLRVVDRGLVLEEQSISAL